MTRVCVVYGTGMKNLPLFFSNSWGTPLSNIRCDSIWGKVPISVISSNNNFIAFLNRHHSQSGHITPPHSIEHRSNIHAAASTSPDVIISINSVGAIDAKFIPGDLGLALDIIDFSTESWSFHDLEAFHSDRTRLFDREVMGIISNFLDKEQEKKVSKLIVAQCTGPQFESPAEINALEMIGVGAVNMTLGPESRLISELSIPHVSLICSSNWAAGRNPQGSDISINHDEVENIAHSMEKTIFNCIDSLINNFKI